MHVFRLHWCKLTFAILLGFLSARIVAAGTEPALTKEQIKQFLFTA